MTANILSSKPVSSVLLELFCFICKVPQNYFLCLLATVQMVGLARALGMVMTRYEWPMCLVFL